MAILHSTTNHLGAVPVRTFNIVRKDAHCALCHEPRTLRDSHVFPQWMREYSAQDSGGKLRDWKNPGKSEQDLVTLYLLCEECEQLFGGYENRLKMATVTLDQLGAKPTVAIAHQDLCYVILAFAWKALQAMRKMQINPYLKVSAPQLYQPYENLDRSSEALAIEEEWRQHLYGEFDFPPELEPFGLVYSGPTASDIHHPPEYQFYTWSYLKGPSYEGVGLIFADQAIYAPLMRAYDRKAAFSQLLNWARIESEKVLEMSAIWYGYIPTEK